MAGFLLGAGSGVLAGAAVYYTLSADLAQSTQTLRSDTHVLSSSFDPVPPPAHSSLVGPSSRHPVPPQSFSDLLRQRWNAALGGAVTGVRETNWSALGHAVWEEGRGLAARLGEKGSEAASAAASSAATQMAQQEAVPTGAPEGTPVVGSPATPKAAVNVDVNRPLKPSAAGIESPKRLV